MNERLKIVVLTMVGAVLLLMFTGSGYAADPGNALSFDGVNDYVTIADAAALDIGVANTAYTVEAWVKPRAGGNGGVVVGKWQKGSGLASYTLNVLSSGKFHSYRNYSPYGINSLSSIPFGQYSHISVSYDGSALRTFINGAETNSLAYPTPLESNGLPLTIGAFLDESGNPMTFFDGEIDEVRLWNISRTATQIQADMHRALSGTETGLAAYYRFDHKTGTTLTDFTANGNHGTLKNIAATAWTASAAMCPFVKFASKVSAEGFTANWYAVSGAAGYQIDVDDNADFSSPIKSNIDAGTGTSFAVTGLNLKPETAYYYRIRSEAGDWLSPNSATLCFMPAPGNALSFDGTDDYVTIGNNASFETANGTMELWISPSWTTPPADHPCIIANRDSTNSARYSVHIKNDKSGIAFYNGSSVNWMSYNFENDKWYHVAVVVSGAKHEIFINGVSMGTGNFGFSASTGLPLHVGHSGSSTLKEYFKGKIDEVRIWNVARTDIEILTTMSKALEGNEAGLAAYYNFDQISGALLPDATGQGRNGAVMNGPVWVASGGYGRCCCHRQQRPLL